MSHNSKMQAKKQITQKANNKTEYLQIVILCLF